MSFTQDVKKEIANLKVDEEVVEGITKDNFDEFFKEKVLSKIN